MKSAQREWQKGAARLNTLATWVVVLLVLYVVYRLLRWFWHWWPHFTEAMRAWWHLRLADPILRLMVKAVDASHGNPWVAIGLVALGAWIFFRLVAILSVASLRTADHMQRTAAERAVGQMENIHARLNKLFPDEVEKVALFGGLSANKPQSTPRYRLGLRSVGCLLAFLWTLLTWPLSLAVAIAVYADSARLFGSPDSLASLRPVALAEALPSLAQTVSIVGFFRVDLHSRSLALTLVIGLLGFVLWLVNSISKTGWTFPRLVDSSPVLIYLAGLLLSYWLLPCGLLIFAAWSLSYSIVVAVLSNFVLGPQILRIRSFLR